MTEDVSGLFYLVNGILCVFVVEAVRRPTVVSVWIPLRRATVLGLLLSAPAFFIHEELSTINEWTRLPDWAWVAVASVLVFLIARAHEWTTELVDRLFDRDFRRAEKRLGAVGQDIQRAESLADIERLLVDEPMRALRLASTALFREEDGVFRRRVSAGWDAADADMLHAAEPPLAGRLDGGRPFRIDGSAPTHPEHAFPAIWRAPFSARPSAIRVAASRSSFTAATKPAPTSTAPSATSWAASPATRGSPIGRLRARCCASNRILERSSSELPSGAECSGSDGAMTQWGSRSPAASRRRLREEQVLTARRKPKRAAFGSCSGGRQAVEMNGTRAADDRLVRSATARSSATGYPTTIRGPSERSNCLRLL